MKTTDQIANDLSGPIQENNASIGEVNRRLAKLGDGQGNVQPNTLLTPRDVFYRSELDQNDRGIAILHPKCPIPLQAIIGNNDMAVWIANVPGSSQVYVVDIAETAGYSTDGLTPTEQLINAAAFPDQSRLVVMRLRPPDDGGLAVVVDVGPYAVAYEKDDGTYGFVATGVADFSDPTDSATYNPVAAALGAGEHRLLGIALDPATGLFVVIPGAAESASSALPQRDDFEEDDYTAIGWTGYYPAGYVYAYYGQTDCEEDDCLRLYDPKLFGRASGSAVGSGFLQDQIDVPITIPAKFQALYANRGEVRPGGRLTTEGRGYVIKVTS